MSAPAKHWRYRLEYETATGVDGATVFIDSTGVFTAVGPYGAYGYHWSPNNRRDCREFILDLTPDYAKDKLSRGRPIFDTEATIARVKELARERLANENRRDCIREVFEDFEGFEGAPDFDAWLRCATFARELDIHDRCACREERFDGDLVAFVDKLLPRLQALIRADLEAEGYFASGVPA